MNVFGDAPIIHLSIYSFIHCSIHSNESVRKNSRINLLLEYPHPSMSPCAAAALHLCCLCVLGGLSGAPCPCPTLHVGNQLWCPFLLASSNAIDAFSPSPSFLLLLTCPCAFSPSLLFTQCSISIL